MGIITNLFKSVPDTKQDWKLDWKEDAKQDWKFDWDSASGATMPAPVNTAAPAISSSVPSQWKVGNTFTGSTGTWTGEGITYSYQWLKNNVAISGATSATYVPVVGDVGATIKIRITATNGGGSASATDSGVIVIA